VEKGIVMLLLVLLTLPMRGENHDDARHTIQLRARAGFIAEGSDYGFKCDFLRITAQGRLGGGFHYLVRQRLNKPIKDGDFLSATDYLFLRWNKGNWELGGGKYYLACGGFEYLASAYDLYIRPEYFNGLGGMYNYAIQATRFFGKESLCIQAGNSIYATGMSKLLGASALLRGRQGPWEHAWSVNVFEREKGLCNLFLCLGNRFHLRDNASLDCSLAHRMDLHDARLMKDFSAVMRLKLGVTDQLDILGKAVWDYKEEGIEDPMLPPGTNIWKAGGGIEYYPVSGSKTVRLHLVGYYSSMEKCTVMAGLAVNIDIL